MITTSAPYSRFVAFYPHDDFLRPIRAYRSHLFASGYAGAFSFPACILLGSAPDALKRGQLNSLAVYLRQQAENASGYFSLSSPKHAKHMEEPDLTYIPMQLHPGHNRLPVDFPVDPFVEQDFILCLTDPMDSTKQVTTADPLVTPVHMDPLLKEPSFSLRFRAGFVANLVVWPANNDGTMLSFFWERGNPVWLPAPPRRKTPK